METNQRLVRDMRDILDIPESEAREAIARETRNRKVRNILRPSSLVLGIGAAYLIDRLGFSKDPLIISLPIVLGAIPGFYSIFRNAVTDYRFSRIEEAGMAYRDNIRKNVPVPKGLEKDRF